MKVVEDELDTSSHVPSTDEGIGANSAVRVLSLANPSSAVKRAAASALSRGDVVCLGDAEPVCDFDS